MKNLFTSFLLLLFLPIAYSQVDLGPSIGIGDLPSNNTPICDIPLYLDGYGGTGFFAGDLIPDFNLFDLNGNELVMSEFLAQGKPVLLIAGSYTCPVFRERINVINALVNQLGDQLEVIVIYELEAHPFNDISPYFGYENPGQANIAEGILYNQPDTYGERKNMVATMLSEVNIQAPIYIDGPCNEWWSNFGPAPNNAYLISTEGIVLSKHPWFNQYPSNILCDLEEFLDIPTNCETGTMGGQFNFTMDGATTVVGEAGLTLYTDATLTNNSPYDVEIEITREQTDLPAGWASSMCIDICYPSTTTSTTILLEAGATTHYTNYFYTDENPGYGKVQIRFQNTEISGNNFTQWMSAETYVNTDVSEVSTEAVPLLKPNPVGSGEGMIFQIDGFTPTQDAILQLLDLQGRKVAEWQISQAETSLSTNNLPAGTYFYRYHDSNGSTHSGRLLIQ